jgi:hypothetical protein
MELEIDLHLPNGSQEVSNADNVTSQPSFSRTKFEVSLSFAARVIDGAWSPGLAGKAIQ